MEPSLLIMHTNEDQYVSKKPRPISFNRHLISAIENTSLGTWPAHPLDFGRPMKAVTRRPVRHQLPATSGTWTQEGTLWRFKPEQGKPVTVESPREPPGSPLGSRTLVHVVRIRWHTTWRAISRSADLLWQSTRTWRPPEAISSLALCKTAIRGSHSCHSS